MKRSLTVIHLSTVIGIGAFALCLLFPLTPTPANSSDMGLALSLHSPKPSDHTSPHTDDILAALTIIS